jgi:hypothetical protein
LENSDYKLQVNTVDKNVVIGRDSKVISPEECIYEPKRFPVIPIKSVY